MGRSHRSSGNSETTNRAAGIHKSILAERFKTKMCGKMVAFGFCDYEGRCMFAHSQHELRTKEQNIADDLVTPEAIKAFQKARIIAAKSAQKKRDRENVVAKRTPPSTPQPQQRPQRQHQPSRDGTPPDSSLAVRPVMEAAPTSRRGTSFGVPCATLTPQTRTVTPSTHNWSYLNEGGPTSTYCFTSQPSSLPTGTTSGTAAAAPREGAALFGIRRYPSAPSNAAAAAIHSACFVDTPPTAALHTPPGSLGGIEPSRAESRATPTQVPAHEALVLPPAHHHIPHHAARDAPLVAFVLDGEHSAGGSGGALPDEPARHPSSIMAREGSLSTPSSYYVGSTHAHNHSSNGLVASSARTVVNASAATLDDELLFAASLTSERGGSWALSASWSKSPGTKVSAANTPTPAVICGAAYDTTKFVSPLAAAMLSQRSW